MKPIPISELLNEGWKLFFYVMKGMLFATVGILHLATLTLLSLAQSLNVAANWMRRYVEEWQPVTPRAFSLEDRGNREQENAE